MDITAEPRPRNYLLPMMIEGQTDRPVTTGETTMTSKTRPALIAFGVAVVIATAATGLTTLRGETKEASIDAACAAAAWPMIPAHCLEGGRGHDVRSVTTDRMEEVG